jgi:hypothetical protein
LVNVRVVGDGEEKSVDAPWYAASYTCAVCTESRATYEAIKL